MDKSTKPEYVHWMNAGGPNECEHGYAEGIPCPNCDASPRIIELRAEIERLRVDNAELSTECDEWGEKVADCWREIEQLRADVVYWKGEYETLRDKWESE